MELFAFALQAVLIVASVALVVVVLAGFVLTAEQVWYEIVTFVSKYRFSVVALILSCYQVALFVWEEKHRPEPEIRITFITPRRKNYGDC